MDDILLASDDLGLLHETKQFLLKNLDMKDMGETSFMIGIEIHKQTSKGKRGLSQKPILKEC